MGCVVVEKDMTKVLVIFHHNGNTPGRNHGQASVVGTSKAEFVRTISWVSPWILAFCFTNGWL
jgi:hypothetical protein